MIHSALRTFSMLCVLALAAVSCSISTENLEGVALSAGERALPAPSQQLDPDQGDADQGDPDQGDPDQGDPDQGDPDQGEPTTAPAPTTVAGAGQATAGAPGLGDLYYPEYGNGGYDVTNYDLDVAWDDDERTIQATATITMIATQALSQFNLDFEGMDIIELTVDGTPANFARDGGELVVTPASQLDLDALVSVVVSYQGKPSRIDGFGAPFPGGWTDLGDTVVVVGEPVGNSGWYPLNEHPTDKALYRISITAESSLTVAANGTQASKTDNGDTTTWVYESAHPQANYLTTVAIGDFVLHDGASSESGIPVRHYFHEDRFEESVITMERTGQMIDVLEDVFGPYPFENYGSIVIDEDLGFALETQTISVFGGDLVDRSASRENIVVHELAHQWFGNHVSLRQWSDIWLNEGFASYSEYLWLEAIEPGYDIGQAIADDHDFYRPIISSPPGAPDPGDLFNASVYIRGGITLHALRTTIGDDAFFQLLATYVQEYGEGNALTRDFTSLAEDISGQDLGEFFDAWLFQDELPDLPQ